MSKIALEKNTRRTLIDTRYPTVSLEDIHVAHDQFEGCVAVEGPDIMYVL